MKAENIPIGMFTKAMMPIKKYEVWKLALLSNAMKAAVLLDDEK